MLKNVEPKKFKKGDKVVIKKEVRKYMNENYNSNPRVYEGDPYFVKYMWEKVKEFKYLTIKTVESKLLTIEEERHKYDARWFEYYVDKIEGVEDF